MSSSVCPKCGKPIVTLVTDQLVEVWIRRKVNYAPGRKIDLSKTTPAILGDPKRVLDTQYCCPNCGADMGENFIMEDIL